VLHSELLAIPMHEALCALSEEKEKQSEKEGKEY